MRKNRKAQLIVLVVLILSFSCCSMSDGCILFHDEEYVPCLYWYADDSEYHTNVAKSGDTICHIRCYEDDPEDHFIYCEEAALLYQKKIFAAPSIYDPSQFSHLMLTFHSEEIQVRIDDPKCFTEIAALLKDLKTVDVLNSKGKNICSLSIYFMNTVPYYAVGNIQQWPDKRYILKVPGDVVGRKEQWISVIIPSDYLISNSIR